MNDSIERAPARANSFPVNKQEIDHECPVCGGAGYILDDDHPDGETCHGCKGTGLQSLHLDA